MAFAQANDMDTSSQEGTNTNSNDNGQNTNTPNQNQTTGQNPATGQNQTQPGCASGTSQTSGAQSGIVSGQNRQMGILNPQIRKSRLAVRVLDDTNQAKMQVEQQNKAAALNSINDALNAITRIQSINANQPAGAQAANLVPIYTEFGQVSVLGPIAAEQQRRDSEGTQGEASRVAPEQQNQPQNQPMQQPPAQQQTVQSVTQEFTDVALNVNDAKQHLEAAQTALNNNNFQDANTALGEVQDGVVLQDMAVNRPLLRARENLVLARNFARQGQFQDMRAPLIAAADALDNYQSKNAPHSSQAGTLSREIRSYAENLSSGNINTGEAMQQINNWWSTTSSFSSSQ